MTEFHFLVALQAEKDCNVTWKYLRHGHCAFISNYICNYNCFYHKWSFCDPLLNWQIRASDTDCYYTLYFSWWLTKSTQSFDRWLSIDSLLYLHGIAWTDLRFAAFRKNLTKEKLGTFKKSGKTWKTQGSFLENHGTQGKLREIFKLSFNLLI